MWSVQQYCYTCYTQELWSPCCTLHFQNIFILHDWNFVPFGQHLPTSSPYPLAPGNHHSILFLWAGLFVIPHTSEIIQYFSSCVWLIALGTMSSRCTHVATNGRVSSPKLMSFHCLRGACVRPVLHPLSVGGHLGRPPVLAAVNNAAVNRGVWMPLRGPHSLSFGDRPRGGLLVRVVILFLTFCGTS